MLEKTLYLPLYRGAKADGWALYRIADGSWGKNPFDLGGCTGSGQAVALEVKVIKGQQKIDKPLPWKQFAEHQIQWLQAFASRPCSLALAGIYEEGTGLMWIYRLEPIDFLDAPVSTIPRTLLTSAQRGSLYTGWNDILNANERKVLNALV